MEIFYSGLLVVREIQGQAKVKEVCSGSGNFRILKKSQGNFKKMFSKAGKIDFIESCA